MKILEEVFIYPCLDWGLRDAVWNYKPLINTTQPQLRNSLRCEASEGELGYVLHIALNCTLEQAQQAYDLHHAILTELHQVVIQEAL